MRFASRGREGDGANGRVVDDEGGIVEGRGEEHMAKVVEQKRHEEKVCLLDLRAACGIPRIRGVGRDLELGREGRLEEARDVPHASGRHEQRVEKRHHIRRPLDGYGAR